ncbi:unnamed protein product, partial [Didymodactylos carnosus]
QDQEIEQKPFINLLDNIPEELTAKQAKFNNIEEEIEQQNTGKESLVAYKKKDNTNDKDQINKKRTYKQSSPDLKGYNVKRNKKLESIRDVYDKTTWLTDFHIYLFFELLHKHFPNINGLCGPAQIHLYTQSLENSIFIFNANNNHWVTISNLDSNNI